MSVEGASKATIARVLGVSPATVGRWIERAACHARRFHDVLVRDMTSSELQADELRGYGPSRDKRLYVFNVLDVDSRMWTSQRVGGRTRRNCRLVMRDARSRIALGQPRVLIVTDHFRYYRDAIGKAWGPTCVHVESGKVLRGGRVMRLWTTLVTGTNWQLEMARDRLEGEPRKMTTSLVERLNLFLRRAVACLHRKTTSVARSAAKMGELVDLAQCYYNFVRPHGSLRFGRTVRTPAQQAGLVSRRLRFRDIFTAFGPAARAAWVVDDKIRAELGRVCVSNS